MMNSAKLRIFFVFLLLFFSACQQEKVYFPNKNSNTLITTFEECVKAGNPVMESYPEQCMANGKNFVRELSFEEKNKLEQNIIKKEDLNKKKETFCENLCGDGICQELVCMSIGCPCAETKESCPEDCK